MTGPVRIVIKHKKEKKQFILQKPPYPEEGETLRTDDGREWEVISVNKVRGPVVLIRKRKGNK